MDTPFLEATDGTYAVGAVAVRHYNTQPERTRASFSKIKVAVT